MAKASIARGRPPRQRPTHPDSTQTGRAGWRDQAACAKPGVDLDRFFPEPQQHRLARAAKRTCNACPVQTCCLEEALGIPGVDGIWGGTTARERTRIRAQRRAAGAA
jgi:WhiB family redox-sensing transcriptional regulator